MAVLQVLVLALALLTHVGPARAQDARESFAQAAARDWLALVDREDVQGSWKAAGKKFQKVIDADRWGEGLKREHERWGKLVQRGAVATTFQKTFPGAPDGDYGVVVFRSSFTTKTDARETVTLEREPDGVWRVIGYLIS